MSVGEELRLAVRLVVVGDGVRLDVGLGVVGGPYPPALPGVFPPYPPGV